MGCPTPTKRAFRSAAAARRWHRRLQRDDKARLWPYQCDCGQFHLTNQNPEEQKRIKAQIDAHLGRVSRPSA